MVSQSKKKVLLALVILAALVAFFATGLHRHLTLESLKSGQASLATAHAENPVGVAAAYFAAYVLVTALSLPGAAILTLAGGAVFGLLQGFLLVSFASTIGATLSFLASRFLFRETIQKRFSEPLARVDQGVRDEGAFFLFSLRLVPLFPFFVVNLLMGLTSIRVATYYWVSQLGMVPGTLAFVNAGTQLGQIDSLKGILSPAVLFSFALLGIFPWIAKLVVKRVKRAKGIRA